PAAWLSDTSTYFIVLPMALWPRHCFTHAKFTFSEIRCVARECFSACGWHFFAGRPASSAHALKIRKNWLRPKRPPFCERKRNSDPSSRRSLNQLVSARSSSSNGCPRCRSIGCTVDSEPLSRRIESCGQKLARPVAGWQAKSADERSNRADPRLARLALGEFLAPMFFFRQRRNQVSWGKCF